MHLTLAAARALMGVVDKGLKLDAVVSEAATDIGGNPSEFRELTYGSCRYYIYLDALVSGMLQKPVRSKDRIVHFLLVCALYQIEYMHAPDYAVVNEAVNALKGTRQSWGGKLVNGVLRNWLREKQKISLKVQDEYLRYAFPQPLFEQLCHDWPDHYGVIAEASNARPPLTLRVNLNKISVLDYAGMLGEADMEYAMTTDSDIGVVLLNPVPVSKIPGFDSGLVSVQDESAQLVAGCMPIGEGQRILDGCAAPGGKACLLLEQRPGLAIVAVDLAERTGLIDENLTRLGLQAEIVAADVRDTGSWWNGKPFDQILMDVPCTGSGVIRRHPDIKHRRQPGDIEKFASQQREMLESVWPLLKTGGTLVYTTCSIFRQENDGVIESFTTGERGFELQLPGKFPGEEMRYGRQRLPGVHGGDGFYYCRMKKTA